MALAESEPEPAPGAHRIEELGPSTAEVVEEARHRVVHLRAAGGDGFVLLAERQYDELVRWTRAVLAVRKVLGTPGADRRPDDFGDTPWLVVFDDEDLATFADGARDAVLAAIDTGTVDQLQALGRRWETTAAVLADPVSREILLGRHKADDFIEVPRPA